MPGAVADLVISAAALLVVAAGMLERAARRFVGALLLILAALVLLWVIGFMFAGVTGIWSLARSFTQAAAAPPAVVTQATPQPAAIAPAPPAAASQNPVPPAGSPRIFRAEDNLYAGGGTLKDFGTVTIPAGVYLIIDGAVVNGKQGGVITTLGPGRHAVQIQDGVGMWVEEGNVCRIYQSQLQILRKMGKRLSVAEPPPGC